MNHRQILQDEEHIPDYRNDRKFLYLQCNLYKLKPLQKADHLQYPLYKHNHYWMVKNQMILLEENLWKK